ncbi:MAG TPA: type II toxin-antitoxin system Phd/YefM family antitoxin [Nevskiaceae bacterium]|nr:type II toxin-antitoxin system Phd/YefM family antitoxin [Nevskiaceae bacterium]
MKTLTSMQAQSRFGELLDSAQREPVTVTRRGRPVAFVVSPEDMRELLDARNERSQAVAELDRFFKHADAHLTPAARKLTLADIKQLVDELR